MRIMRYVPSTEQCSAPAVAPSGAQVIPNYFVYLYSRPCRGRAAQQEEGPTQQEFHFEYIHTCIL